jgi:hypothetical protein
MGCFGSRDSQRQEKFGQDFNLVPHGFRKAELTNIAAFAPVDKLAAEFIGAEKDIMESKIGEFNDMNFSKADELKAVATHIFNLIKGVFKAAKDDSNDKENAFGNKYKISEVTEQLNKVLEAIAATDEKLEWPEKEEGKEETKEENKDKAAEENKDAAAEPEKEGGESDQYEGGSGDFCKVFLEQVCSSTVLFDLIKAAVLSVELDSFDPLDFGKMGKMAISFIPLLPDPKEWAGAAAILCIMVNQLEGEPQDKEIFAKMKCTNLNILTTQLCTLSIRTSLTPTTQTINSRFLTLSMSTVKLQILNLKELRTTADLLLTPSTSPTITG